VVSTSASKEESEAWRRRPVPVVPTCQRKQPTQRLALRDPWSTKRPDDDEDHQHDHQSWCLVPTCPGATRSSAGRWSNGSNVKSTRDTLLSSPNDRQSDAPTPGPRHADAASPSRRREVQPPDGPARHQIVQEREARVLHDLGRERGVGHCLYLPRPEGEQGWEVEIRPDRVDLP
jgi:hypothetical protein